MDDREEIEPIEDLEVEEDAADEVAGGVRPVSPPSGPVPIPDPNLPTKP